MINKDILGMYCFQSVLIVNHTGIAEKSAAEEGGRLDLASIDVNKRLSDCASLLEFIITSLGKHLSLKPKQVRRLPSSLPPLPIL